MNKKKLFKIIPKLPLSVLLWAALAVGILITLVIAEQRYQWSDDLVTTLRTLTVLLIGIRIITTIKRTLAESRVELLSRIAQGDEEPIKALSWKDSVTGVYAIHILLYAGLALLVIFAVGGTLSGFLVSGTLLSVMLGVAGQSFFANFFGGLAIAVFKPFELGDHVQLVAWQLPIMALTYPHETRSQGYCGLIRDINLFYSEIRLDDGRLMRIPNGVVINAGIQQIRHHEWLRTSFRFDIPMSGDLERLLARIAAAANRRFSPDEGSMIGAGAPLSPGPRIDLSVPGTGSVNEQGEARLVHAAWRGGSDRPLSWYPPEVDVVDVGPAIVSVEVHASVLHRKLGASKNQFFRELLADLSSPEK